MSKGHTYPLAGDVRRLGDFLLEIAKGRVPGHSLFRRFGYNAAIGATEEDIWSVSSNRTWLTTAISLRIAAGGDAEDDADGGDGAREITIQYLDGNFVLQQEALDTAGVGASSNTSGDCIRFVRAWVSKAGLYTGDNEAAVVIETSDGGSTQGHIVAGAGQTEQTHYTVPAGKKAYLGPVELTVNSNKAVDLFMYRREGADVVAAPFTSRREVHRWTGLVSPGKEEDFKFYEAFDEKTDIWFTGTASGGGGEASVDYGMIIVDK